MGAIYSLPISAVSVSAQQDLYEILAPATKSIRLVRLIIEQEDLTSIEQWRITAKRVTGAPTSGSGGGTITPVAPNTLLGSSGLTVERNNTTRISGGTSTIFMDRVMDVINGLDWVPSRPDEELQAEGAEHIVIGLETTPSGATDLSATAFVEVMG